MLEKDNENIEDIKTKIEASKQRRKKIKIGFLSFLGVIVVIISLYFGLDISNIKELKF